MSIWNDSDDLPMPDGQAFSQESTKQHLFPQAVKRPSSVCRGTGAGAVDELGFWNVTPHSVND
jgi:hypothetical protein